MAFVKACYTHELETGEMIERDVEDRPVLVCNVDGEYHAVHARCPHLNGPLAHGALHGHTIVCPWHAWEFDCRTGIGDPRASVRVYPVRVEEGHVLVGLE